MPYNQTTNMFPGQNPGAQLPQGMPRGPIPVMPKLPMQDIFASLGLPGFQQLNQWNQQAQNYNRGVGFGPSSYETEGGGYMHQFPTQTPQGMQYLQALLNMSSQGLGSMPSPQFGPIKQAYEQHYRQNVMPSLAERFASLGGEGAAGSSAFKSSMLGAENQLQTQLAGMENKFNQENMLNLLKMGQLGLMPQFQTAYQQPENWWGKLIGGTANAAISTAPYWGPMVF